MKHLVPFVILFVTLVSCKKNNTAPGQSTKDSIAIVTAEIAGQWVYHQAVSKTIQKKDDGGIILKPDGTPIDTVKDISEFQVGSYWTFNGNKMTVLTKVNGTTIGPDEYAYEVQNNGRAVQVIGGKTYTILKRNNTTLELYSTYRGGTANNRYTEYHVVYYMRR